MCGIVGSYHPLSAGGSVGRGVMESMRDAMEHRGPDGAGYWRSEDGKCALGHRRLSIIDLSESANQPMLSADGKLVIVFNGEIYNHQQIRREIEALGKYRFRTDHSDTETLLYAFAEWGIDCVEKLYGMFAFAVYDMRNPHNPVLHLCRDRIGIKPLYFSRTNKGEWLFASEIKALLKHPHVHRDMDSLAFNHYLSFIVAPAPLTMFKGIFKLPAGYCASIHSDGTSSARQYYDCRPFPGDLYTEAELPYEDAVSELTRLLKKSIERRMVSDVPFGVLLSGGVDSSLNVALMSELMDRPVTTFTVGYERYDQFNEYDHAQTIARQYNTDHHETRINSQEALDFLPKLVEMQDEPIADNVCIPLYFLARLVKESGTTVVQVGEGADENFLGYWWCDHYRDKFENIYAPIKRGQLDDNLRGLIDKSHGVTEDHEIAERAWRGKELFWGGAICWWGALKDQLIPAAEKFDFVPHCPIPGLIPAGFLNTDSHGVVAEYLHGMNWSDREDEALLKIPYMELKLRLPEHLLMRVDKMTMAHSIEARVPFLDHDVVEFARRCPPHYKLKDGLGKRVLKKAAEPYMSEDLLYRRKQGFGAPMDKWFTESDFGPRTLALYKRSEIKKRNLLNNSYVEDLLKGQVSGKLNYGFHLWNILNAVLWHEHWIGDGLDSF